ncbi:MAG: hypothetical protein K0B06_04025 [Brevefilum sp.]|nr:hypothetical protein [Brevefilum sp.]
MATITSVGSGLWSVAGTWDAGVPVDGDDVVIASGHVVTFDVDQSAFVTGVSLTITGTLTHTTSAGSYCLFIKTGASVVGAGNWYIGTSGNPIPFSSKHLIMGAAGWYIDGNSGLAISVFGSEPVNTTIRLSSAAIATDTVLNVDTDVTGDIWQAGDEIVIDDIIPYCDGEKRTIAVGGIASSTITITAGLTNAKGEGTLVHLLTRNVRVIGDAGVTRYFFYQCHNFIVGSGEFQGNYYRYFAAVNNSSGIFIIYGGIFYGFNRVHSACQTGNFYGGVFSYYQDFGTNSNNIVLDGPIILSNGKYGLSRATAAKGVLVSGCDYGAYGLSIYDNVTIQGCGRAIDSQSGSIFTNCTVTGNSYILSRGNYGIYLDCVFDRTEPNVTNFSISRFREVYMINKNLVAGSIWVRSNGGIVSSQNSVLPTGYSQAYQHALSNNDFECHWYKSFTVAAGETVVIDLHLRKDSSMSYLPRALLMEGVSNPLMGAAAIQTFIMTDSVDVWEQDSFSITNNTDYDHDYVLWFLAKNASGNAYSAYNIQTVPDTSDIAQAVWTYATKELTTPADYMADVSALATSAELTALNDLDAAGIRAAIGLAAANLDQQFLDLVAWAAINLDESITAGEIIQIRGNSWSIPIEDLILSENKQQFAIKYTHLNASLNQSASTWQMTSPDADSLIFIDSDSGLLYLNGVQAADSSLGSLSYVGSTLTITLSAAATYLLAPGAYIFGIQSVDALGFVSEAYGGTFTILADVVRSVS